MTSIPSYSENYNGYQIMTCYDEFAQNPREWSNISKLICWSYKYKIGDEHNYNPDLFILELMKEVCPKEVIWEMLTTVNKSDHQRYIKVEKRNGFYYTAIYDCNGELGEEFKSVTIEGLRDAVIDFINKPGYINEFDCVRLIEKYAYLQPVSIYDHSGIKLYIGSKVDPWDSYQVGWAYIKYDDLKDFDFDITESNRKNMAKEIMAGELKIYNDYISGEVYRTYYENPDGNIMEDIVGIYGSDLLEDEITLFKHQIDLEIAENE